jgi:flavodoxin
VSGILVVDYSRSGNTHEVAKAIARGCGGDLERIHDERSRTGLWGYLRSAREALKAKPSQIRRPKYDPADYDLVVLGSPVWAGHMSSPMRRYLLDHEGKLSRIAVFVTEGGRGGSMAHSEMSALARRRALAKLEVRASDLGDDMTDEVADFVDVIKRAVAPIGSKPA